MWFLRRMLKVRWTAKLSNIVILKQAKMNRRLIIEVRKKRQSQFIGHILRKGKIECTIATGKIIGKRDRGRQREKILDSLSKWHGIGLNTQLINITGDRNMWRCMTNKAHDDDEGDELVTQLVSYRELTFSNRNTGKPFLHYKYVPNCDLKDTFLNITVIMEELSKGNASWKQALNVYPESGEGVMQQLCLTLYMLKGSSNNTFLTVPKPALNLLSFKNDTMTSIGIMIFVCVLLVFLLFSLCWTGDGQHFLGVGQNSKE